MKNILVIHSGGRLNGNTAQLIDAFTRGAEEAGHHVERISLLQMKVNPCIGCNACRWGKPCVQKDDFNRIAPKIQTADLLVFASPLHNFTYSAHLHALIERYYCLLEPNPHPTLGRYGQYPFARDCALLMTAADKDFWTFEPALNQYRFTLIQYFGYHDKGHVLAYGCGSCEEQPHVAPQYLEEAYTFGRNVYPAEN